MQAMEHGQAAWSGICIEILKALATSLNFTYVCILMRVCICVSVRACVRVHTSVCKYVKYYYFTVTMRNAVHYVRSVFTVLHISGSWEHTLIAIGISLRGVVA